MNKNQKKRLMLFNKFSNNWELLKQNNLLIGINQKFVRNYICPICTLYFSPKDLNQNLKNPLTLEDSPPKSLGGKANTLTCKDCNNTLGRKVDSHLASRLRQIDRSKFLKGAEHSAKLKSDKEQLQGNIKVEEDGLVTLSFSPKNNNKNILDKVMTNSKSEDLEQKFRLFIPEERIDYHKLSYAILKTAYLLLFEKFGYSILFNNVYQKIRDQLLNPESNSYPLDFFKELPIPKDKCGIHLVTEKGLKSIFVIFELVSKTEEKIIAAILPTPNILIEDTLEKINDRKKEISNSGIGLVSIPDTIDLLNNMDGLKKVLKWFKKDDH